MPKTSREPSLLKDIGAIADLYLDVFRLMGRRMSGQGPIITYSPPGDDAAAPLYGAADEVESEPVLARR